MGRITAEAWQYRELFFFLVWRDIKIRYKQTALGAAWAIIQPFFTMIIFTLFFGRLAQLPNDGIPYPVFYYSALVPWTYFANSVGLSGNSLINNANLIRKVYFPRVALPGASGLGGLVDFAIAFLVLLAMMVFYDIPLSFGLLLWPVLMVPMVFLVIGLGMFLSALNVKYRDIKYAIPFFIQSLLFITPIIYPRSIVPDRFQYLLYLNPLSGLIEAFRASMLPTRDVAWGPVGISVVVILVIFSASAFFFHRTQRQFADII